MHEEPRDPFLDEARDNGPVDHDLRTGQLLFRALADIPSAAEALEAMENMPDADLRAVVLQRLYIWHATKYPDNPGAVDAWLRPADADI